MDKHTPNIFMPAPGQVRNDHPAESHAAASSIAAVTGIQRRVVLRAIANAGLDGLHDEEGVEASGVAASSYRPRRGELAGEGHIEVIGRRKTLSGRSARVWAVTKTGLWVLEKAL